jgi:hemerythrin superfamily protein
MDAVDLLVSQHREMEHLLEKVLDAENEAETKMLFADAGDQLTVHITSEEQIFYPAVKAARTEDILLESLEEHLSLKRFLADLIDLEPSEKTFEPKFKVLKEQVEHHHKEEEEHLFPKVRTVLSQAQCEKLGKEMMALQTRLQKQSQPRDAVIDQTDAASPLD